MIPFGCIVYFYCAIYLKDTIKSTIDHPTMGLAFYKKSAQCAFILLIFLQKLSELGFIEL